MSANAKGGSHDEPIMQQYKKFPMKRLSNGAACRHLLLAVAGTM